MKKLRYIPLLVLALAAMFILGGAVSVATLSVTTSTRTMSVMEETMNVDPDVIYRPQGIAVAGTVSAVGATCATAVEATTSNPTIRTAETSGNYRDRLLITETTGSSWPSGRLYRADLYADGVAKGSLYFKNNTTSTSVEGLTAEWDLGTTTPTFDTYSLVVTLLATC